MEKKNERRDKAQDAPRPDRKARAARPGQRRGGAEELKGGSPTLVELAVRGILTPYVNALERLYDCSCKEKLMFRIDVECTDGKDGIRTLRAELLTSRVDRDSKEYRDGVVTERRWSRVHVLQRKCADGREIDTGRFCTSFIEWCTFTFTDRRALVRALNPCRRSRFLWFRLP